MKTGGFKFVVWISHLSHVPLHCKRQKVLTEEGHTLVAQEHLDSSWAHSSAVEIHVSILYLFIETSIPCQLLQYWEYLLEKKRKTKKPYIGGPSLCSPWCWDWSPITNPGPLRVLDSLSCSGLTLGEGRLDPLPPSWPWQLKGSFQMKFLGLKWTATRALPFSGDFIPQDTRRQNPHLSNMARSVNWKQQCLTFLCLCECEWPCDFLLSHMITHCRHTSERMPREVGGCGTWNPSLVVYKP